MAIAFISQRDLSNHFSDFIITMTQQIGKELDLNIAWKRTKTDLNDDAFVRHPFIVKLIDIDAESWLQTSQQNISSGTYYPSPMLVCDVPKPKFAVRPGSILTMQDRLIYSACIGHCLDEIHSALRWSQGTIDFGHMLAATPTDSEWLINPFTCWDEFRKKSINTINRSVKYVVFADIVGFYENIDLGLLISDLKTINAPSKAVNLISTSLNRWAQIAN